MTSDTTVQPVRVAGLGALGVALGYLTLHHYLYVEWQITAPVPVVWWVLGAAASLAGPPLLFTALGWGAARLVERPWRALILRWTLPLLAGHVLWLLVVVAVLRRFPEGITPLPVRDLPELLTALALPPAELSLLLALALAPLVAKAARPLPTWLVLGVLAALALAGPAPAVALFFLVAGLRLSAPLDRLADGATWPRLTLLTGVCLLAAALLVGVPALLGVAAPEGVRAVVAGLVVAPFGVTAAALCGRHLAVPGRSAVLACLALVPATAVVDDLVLTRLSTSGSAVQFVAALVEPLVLAAGVLAAAVAATAGWRRARELRKVTAR
jgi:hypothetical protein